MREKLLLSLAEIFKEPGSYYLAISMDELATRLALVLDTHEHRDVVLSRGFLEEGNRYRVEVAVCSVCGRVLDPFGVQGLTVTKMAGDTVLKYPVSPEGE